MIQPLRRGVSKVTTTTQDRCQPFVIWPRWGNPPTRLWTTIIQQGLPIVPGYIEVVESGDPLAGVDEDQVGEMKVLAWRGPDYVEVIVIRKVVGIGYKRPIGAKISWRNIPHHSICRVQVG